MAVRFQAGGTLRPGMLYVERAADQELLQTLRQGEISYVLAPRQIGKSSLRERTQERLEALGVSCAAIDLSSIGKGVTAEEWYFGLCSEVWRQLGLSGDLNDWWRASPLLPPVQRWSRFLREKVLVDSDRSIVIFLDEIDVTLSLSIPREDFFSSIRAMHNARGHDAAFTRLTFCLLGVASPDQLMNQKEATPFNVGRAIALEDFTWEEAKALAVDLPGSAAQQERALRAVLTWTEGQPYLTQRLCAALAAVRPDPPLDVDVSSQVERLVSSLFLQRGTDADPSLAYAERRFREGVGSAEFHERVVLYRQLLLDRQVQADSASQAQWELRLAGLVKVAEGRLRIRNLLVRKICDAAWLTRQEEAASGSTRAEMIRRGLVALMMIHERLDAETLLKQGWFSEQELEDGLRSLSERGWFHYDGQERSLGWRITNPALRCEHTFEVLRYFFEKLDVRFLGVGSYDDRIDEHFVRHVCKLHGVSPIDESEEISIKQILRCSPGALRFSLQPPSAVILGLMVKDQSGRDLPDIDLSHVNKSKFLHHVLNALITDYRTPTLFDYFYRLRNVRELESKIGVLLRGPGGVLLQMETSVRESISQVEDEGRKQYLFSVADTLTG